ncbi:hypothetical protein KUCAC02_033360 [Chaenocephalus aceratus]|nr:hypothetical protein KUCAC02_033360 [Chaenocephalus aceratus]
MKSKNERYFVLDTYLPAEQVVEGSPICRLYVKVFCGSATLGETSVRHNDRNPWWEEDFAHFKARENDVLKLEVHDHDIGFDDLLGVCQRKIKLGTHEYECFLEEGGSLHYTYSLK